jgi:hypothetical protein
MKNEHKPIRSIFDRIFLATIMALLMPFIGIGSNEAFAKIGFSLGVTYGNSDVEFLSAYGSWMEVTPYGQVWVPSVASDWRPFAYGDWMWTSNGWLWSSYEPYGWLVYHYGHWDYRPDIGWFWISGTTWTPAAVVWLNIGDYVCWAPAPPGGVSWPRPWESEPSGFNAWIGVRIGDFDREDVGSFRIHEFPGREAITRERIFSGPPNISSVRKFSDHRIATHNIQRRSVNWQQHRFDRIIPPRSQQRVIQRWRHDMEGKVYMPRGVPQERRAQVERRGAQQSGRGQAREHSQSQRQEHNNGGGHAERGRRH